MNKRQKQSAWEKPRAYFELRNASAKQIQNWHRKGFNHATCGSVFLSTVFYLWKSISRKLTYFEKEQFRIKTSLNNDMTSIIIWSNIHAIIYWKQLCISVSNMIVSFFFACENQPEKLIVTLFTLIALQ